MSVCLSVCVCSCVCVSACLHVCFPSLPLAVSSYVFFLSTPISSLNYVVDVLVFMYMFSMHVKLRPTSVRTNVHNLKVTTLIA